MSGHQFEFAIYTIYTMNVC